MSAYTITTPEDKNISKIDIYRAGDRLSIWVRYANSTSTNISVTVTPESLHAFAEMFTKLAEDVQRATT